MRRREVRPPAAECARDEQPGRRHQGEPEQVVRGLYAPGHAELDQDEEAAPQRADGDQQGDGQEPGGGAGCFLGGLGSGHPMLWRPDSGNVHRNGGPVTGR